MSDVGRIGPVPAAGDPDAAESAAVTRFLDDLRSLGEGPAPRPSPELAALLAGVPALTAARRRGPRIVRRVALIAAAVVAGTTLAAVNHRLPAPAQRVVSNVVNDLTPFHIGTPRPAPTTTTPIPSPTPTHVAPVPVRSSEDSSEPSEPHSSAEPGDGGGGADDSSPAAARGGDSSRDDGERSSSAPARSQTSDGGGGGSDSLDGSGGSERSGGSDGGGD